MPQMGYDMTQGTVVRWLKGEGEEVRRGEIIAEIETDKAVVEMEAYASGVLRKIVVGEGATVPVGEIIGIIAGPDEPLPDLTKAVASRPAEASPAEPPPPKVEQKAEVTTPAPADEVRASPVARRLADEKGIDIRQVTGTGPGGRITRDDVLAYESQVEEAAPAPAPEAPAPAGVAGAPEVVPLSRMRQAIARLTSRSKREVPHFYVTADIDMTEAMSLRQRLNKALEGEGIRVSVNDMLVKAVTKALKSYPNFNSFFQEDKLQVNPSINVGIAIALEEGLIVPAIMNCEGKSLQEIAKASRDLVERANRGVLHPDEYTSGTFSISNLGMFDVDSFVAIIHPPQSAVLAVGTVKKQPVVKDDQISIAQVMKATIAADHRVVDGAQAAQFMVEVKQLLENPVSLLV